MTEGEKMRRDVRLLERYMNAVVNLEILAEPIPHTLAINADRALRRLRKYAEHRV